jgi:predicted ester cyclase
MSLKDFVENEFIKAENEAWENGDFRALEKLLDPNIVVHMPPPLSDLKGIKAVRQYVLGTRLAISNFTQRWQYLTGDGDVFALLHTESGVFTGVTGVPTNGKEITIEGLFVFRLKDRKVVEEWVRGGVIG